MTFYPSQESQEATLAANALLAKTEVFDRLMNGECFDACIRYERGIPCMCDFDNHVQELTWEADDDASDDNEKTLALDEVDDLLGQLTGYMLYCLQCHDDQFTCECCPTGKHESVLEDFCDCKCGDRFCEGDMSFVSTKPVQGDTMFGMKDKRKSGDEHVHGFNDTTGQEFRWCAEHQSKLSACIEKHTSPAISEYEWCMAHFDYAKCCKDKGGPLLATEVCKFQTPAIQGDGRYAGQGTARARVFWCQEHNMSSEACMGKTHDKPGQMSLMDTSMPGDRSGGGRKTKADAPKYEPEPIHVHPPTMVIDGGEEGWSIWCGKGSHVEKRTKGFDVVINLTGYSIKERHNIPLEGLSQWNSGGMQSTEVMLDWKDYNAVTFPLQFWLDLMAYIQQNKLKVLVFCVGGHGRTGTAVALMMMVALNMNPVEAVGWLRKNYCHKAVESQSQVDYLQDIYDEIRKAAGETVVDSTDTLNIVHSK